MRSKFIIAAAGAGMIALAAQGADAKLLGRITKVGNWTVGAYSFDESPSRFSHCGAWALYHQDMALFFLVNRDYQWGVAFKSPFFNLTPGNKVRVNISMDEGSLEPVIGKAIDRDFFRINLAPNSELFKRFMRSSVLRLYASDQTHSFSLTDTSKLLPELLKCTRDRLNPPPLQAQQNGPSAENQRVTASTPAQPATDIDLRAEVTSLAANLLSEAGVKGFRLIPVEDSKMNVRWTSPTMVGALFVTLDPAIKRPGDVTPGLIAAAAGKCRGKFASGAMPEENGSARAFTSCQIGTGDPETGYYLTLPRSAGGYYVILMWPQSASALMAPSQEPDKDVRNAAYRVLK